MGKYQIHFANAVLAKGDLGMVASSVTGSFRGIEVSFTYNGPHIVMSVSNKDEDGRHLRVMFQQQPLGGRVNWTAFQLSRQTQEVVVPTEVIQSHKLAFYVDNHEPISTYTEKILEELKQIQNQPLIDNQSESSASEVEQQTPLDPQVEQGQKNELNHQTCKQENGLDDKTLEKKSEVAATLSNMETPENSNFEENIDSERNTIPEFDASTPLEPQNIDVNPNGDGDRTEQQEHTPNKTALKEGHEVAPILPKSDSDNESAQTPKRKTQYIGHYLPSVNSELQFKIKVPSLPKSVSQKQSTFIPPRPAATSKSNEKKDGLFGQLAGTFGFTLPKKKEYYVQQNRHLYDKFHATLEKLESDYNNGCGIPLDNWDLEALSEQQTAVLLLNLMVNEVSEWKKAAKKGNTTQDTLAKSLETIENELKQTLKHTRGIQAPAPTLFPDRTASTDKDLMDIQQDCDIYLQRFSHKLSALEQKHAEKVKIPAFKKFLVEFIRDKVFPNVAEFSSLNMVQSRLNWFLDLVDYELMPIEPGKTKFSPEHHKLKEKRSCEFESDTIVEVVSPGLQSKGGERVIQNAVVVQAE